MSGETICFFMFEQFDITLFDYSRLYQHWILYLWENTLIFLCLCSPVISPIIIFPIIFCFKYLHILLLRYKCPSFLSNDFIVLVKETRRGCEPWNVTRDIWHVSHDTQGVMNILSNFRSLALMVWVWRCFEDIFTNHHRLNEWQRCL